MRLRIATLFGCSLSELGERLPASEFYLWWAYYQLEPWGFHASDYLAGVQSSTFANFSGNAKKQLNPSDFMVDMTRIRKQVKTVEQEIRTLQMVLN